MWYEAFEYSVISSPAGSTIACCNVGLATHLINSNFYICLPAVIVLVQPVYSPNMDAKALSSAVAEFSAKFCNVSKFVYFSNNILKVKNYLLMGILEYNLSFFFPQELSKSTSVVSSPLSAEFVLALLALGSTDPAHSELLKSLGIPGDDDVSIIIIL